MYILHWEYMAGSIVAEAILRDVGADFHLQHVDMANGEHQTPGYRRINPTGRVPALSLPGGTTIGETGAIVTYLGEAFPGSGMTPQPGDPDRAEFLFWLNVMATTGYITVGRWAHPERFAASERAITEVETKAAADLNGFFDVMEAGIMGAPTILSRGFTALDYYLAMLTEWPADRAALFATHPKIEALYHSVAGRAVYKKAMNTHALPAQAA